LYENSLAREPNPRSTTAPIFPKECANFSEAIPNSKEFCELVKLVALFVAPGVFALLKLNL